MSHSTLPSLFFIALCIQLQALSPKYQLLTPGNHNINGANITTTEVTSNRNNEWDVIINSQTAYQFILSLDKSWGFHPYIKSSIVLTINSPTIAQGPDENFDDIVFGFTTNNEQYLSIWIPMDNNGQKNRIYPTCDTSVNPTQTYAIGDISTLPNTDRNCDVAGGSCSNWNTMYPKNAQYPTVYEYNGFPITFTLENDPISQTLLLYFNTATFSTSFVQKCGFIALPTHQGLQIYIGGHDIGQMFTISSFRIESLFNTSDPRSVINEATVPSMDHTADMDDNVTVYINNDDDKIDSKMNAKNGGNNVVAIVGVIVAVLLFIGYCVYKTANDDKNGIEVGVDVEDNAAAAPSTPATSDGRKYSCEEGLNEGEMTGNNVRWHNLNLLLQQQNEDGSDGEVYETIEIDEVVDAAYV